MKILFIGDFGQAKDEGMRNLSRHITENLKNNYNVLCISTKDFILLKKIGLIKKFNPDIIHYLTGPTIRSLLSLSLYKQLLSKHTTTVSSGLRPYLNAFGRMNLKYFKPDVFLSQSVLWEELFHSAGADCIPIPNFINTAKFYSVDDFVKEDLRKKYFLPQEKKIILHVGHIKRNRNLEILADLQRKSVFQVLIVGSSTLSKDKQVKDLLINSGCIIISDYLPHIEEIYQLSDIYVFPVKTAEKDIFPKNYNSIGVIDFPLSILEGMACNLPVITTPFDAVQRFIGGSRNGFEYFTGALDDLINKVNSVDFENTRTREIAIRFDSRKILNMFMSLYQKIGANN